MFLDYAALAILFFVVITLFYAVIAIHDVPYEIAQRLALLLGSSHPSDIELESMRERP